MQADKNSNKQDCIQLKLYHLKKINHKLVNICSALGINSSNRHNKLASSFIFTSEHLTQFSFMLQAHICDYEAETELYVAIQILLKR